MITRAIATENSSATILTRVLGADGNPVTRADVSAVTVKVWDRDGAALINTHTPDVADAIYDTLQLDPRWTFDSTGYNLAIDIPGADLPDGDTTYRIEIKLTPTSGDGIYVIVDLKTENILSE